MCARTPGTGRARPAKAIFDQRKQRWLARWINADGPSRQAGECATADLAAARVEQGVDARNRELGFQAPQSPASEPHGGARRRRRR